MSDELIKRLRSQKAVDGRPHEIEQLTDEAAAMIEQQADQLLDARRTAEYWKAEHNAANARIAALEAQIAPVAPAVDAQPALTVWYGSMPESNGKSNWTAILHRGDIASGMTIDRSEYPDRVRYEADRVRWLIGELAVEPWILDYDADKHSDYASVQSQGLRKDAVPDGVEVASYRLADDPDMTVQRIGQVTGPDLWAVRYGGNCLGKDGEWEYEPMPSSRDADFLARCRFASAQEAIDAAIRALSQKESQ